MHAYLPPCLEVKRGEEVRIAECRRLAKTVSFVVIEVNTKDAAGAKSRAVSAKGVEEFRPYITRAIPVTANLVCTDNTGANIAHCASDKIQGKTL